EAARQARAAGVDVLVVPELATTGYGIGDALFELAEKPGGGQARAIGAAAEELGLTIVAGFPERAGDAIYNAALVATPAGARHVYRKCQLYGDYEKRRFARGPVAPEIFEISGGVRLGVLICFDVEFPEHVRRLVRAGADLIAVPTALPDEAG